MHEQASSKASSKASSIIIMESGGCHSCFNAKTWYQHPQVLTRYVPCLSKYGIIIVTVVECFHDKLLKSRRNRKIPYLPGIIMATKCNGGHSNHKLW